MIHLQVIQSLMQSFFDKSSRQELEGETITVV